MAFTSTIVILQYNNSNKKVCNVIVTSNEVDIKPFVVMSVLFYLLENMSKISTETRHRKTNIRSHYRIKDH